MSKDSKLHNFSQELENFEYTRKKNILLPVQSWHNFSFYLSKLLNGGDKESQMYYQYIEHNKSCNNICRDGKNKNRYLANWQLGSYEVINNTCLCKFGDVCTNDGVELVKNFCGWCLDQNFICHPA